jgi:hypothetical protein
MKQQKMLNNSFCGNFFHLIKLCNYIEGIMSLANFKCNDIIGVIEETVLSCCNSEQTLAFVTATKIISKPFIKERSKYACWHNDQHLS